MVLGGGSKRAWSKIASPLIDELATNTFIFYFPNTQSADHVWEKRPWLISNVTMVVKKWFGRGLPQEVNFDRADIWVQVHNLEWDCRNRKTMTTLASSFSEHYKIDESGLQGGRWYDYLRMRVEVDITRPLRAGITTPEEEGGD
ncbi:hypothetical protein LINGRAHAP2_LOCUS31398 [Linum grandiflorum]